ncbi:unnamed protein product [Paramecium octaurelia]|uniref:Uncharacterized protein n=1 Tax=Paramecium octaurelia TaxID=43137 RepID=A0A8S1YC64_PAROT|nr:unnamed protein product [Paramecium octaurelia]
MKLDKRQMEFIAQVSQLIFSLFYEILIQGFWKEKLSNYLTLGRIQFMKCLASAYEIGDYYNLIIHLIDYLFTITKFLNLYRSSQQNPPSL